MKTEELTLPGFKHDTCSTAHGGIQANPIMRNDELHLIRDYGIEYIEADPINHMPFADGSYITQWPDLDRTCAEFGKFSKKDAEAYIRMYDESDAVKSVFAGISLTPPGLPENPSPNDWPNIPKENYGSAAWPCRSGRSSAKILRTTTAARS